MNEADDHRVNTLVAGALLLIVAMGVTDLILDAPPSLLSGHVFIEILLLGTSLGLSVFLIVRQRQANRRLLRVRKSLGEHRSEVEAWRSQAEAALRGLGEQIDLQLRAWGLTHAEREVAMLLLKGLSHKEIADILDKSERTVRQQAVTLYRKSHLSGRAELSAFFLEDLLPPSRKPEEATGSM